VPGENAGTAPVADVAATRRRRGAGRVDRPPPGAAAGGSGTSGVRRRRGLSGPSVRSLPSRALCVSSRPSDSRCPLLRFPPDPQAGEQHGGSPRVRDPGATSRSSSPSFASFQGRATPRAARHALRQRPVLASRRQPLPVANHFPPPTTSRRQRLSAANRFPPPFTSRRQHLSPPATSRRRHFSPPATSRRQPLPAANHFPQPTPLILWLVSHFDNGPA
jgi:hypothetical protein